jgi:hypothetical protein
MSRAVAQVAVLYPLADRFDTDLVLLGQVGARRGVTHRYVPSVGGLTQSGAVG